MFVDLQSVLYILIVQECLLPEIRPQALLLYLFLGWLIIFDIQTLFNLIDTNAKNLVILGGVFYTVGVIFYLSENIKNNHAIWHVFVLFGSISHYFLMLFYVI